MPPHTTKRRTTTNLKTKTTRTDRKSNCIEVRQPRVKEETLTQPGRRGGDGQLGGQDSPQGDGWQTVGGSGVDWVVPHSCADKS